MTFPRRVFLLLAVCCLAGLPSTVRAAPPWSAPQDLSAPHLFASDPAIAFAGDGTALAAWRWQDGIREQAHGGEAAAARAPGAAAFGAERRLSPAGRVGRPLMYGRSRTVLGLVRPVGSNRDPRSQLRVAFGRADGSFGGSRLIVARPRIAPPRLAGNARGDLAFAWFEDRGTSNDRVHVSLRRAGGSFGSPILIAQERVRSVSVAVGTRGDVLVAWDARGVVRTRVKAVGRASFGPVETIRSEDAFFADLRTALTANGRAYVAWGAQLRTEGGDTGPVFFHAAVRPAGGSRFRAAQLLDRLGAERAANPLELAIVGGGSAAVVAWTGYDGSTNRVRVAETDAAGRFGGPLDVSPPGTDAVLSDLAAGAGGQRLAVWTATSATQRRQVQAAFAAPGATFGPPELVSANEEADTGGAAFDPRTAVPTVLWVNRAAGSTQPLTDIRTFAQAAARTGFSAR
ncbi:MAG TPA: hypothetical protein VES79_06270 [Solirubrobacteraceae bacterium]|nr:hypothetical protein [Solirubrobacteraceae bacterium]